MSIDRVAALMADRVMRVTTALPLVERLGQLQWPDCVGCTKIDLRELFENAGATVTVDEKVWMESGEMGKVDLVARKEEDGKANAFAFQLREHELRLRDTRPMRWADGFPVQIVFIRDGTPPDNMRGWPPAERPDYVVLMQKRTHVPDHEHRCRKLVIVKPGDLQMPSSFDAKDERMYSHIRDSGLSKAAAAATVNKYRARHGKTKKKRKRKR